MFRGSNTSLYSTLDALAVENLEQAIHLTNLGYYEKAISIFEHKLSEFRHTPVVVIERADLHFQRYQFGVTRGVLEDGLKYSSDVDLDRPEYRLILLYLAAIRCYSKGDFRFAVREIDRTREWLADVAVEKYTDIQVSYLPWLKLDLFPVSHA